MTRRRGREGRMEEVKCKGVEVEQVEMARFKFRSCKAGPQQQPEGTLDYSQRSSIIYQFTNPQAAGRANDNSRCLGFSAVKAWAAESSSARRKVEASALFHTCSQADKCREHLLKGPGS
ncbi:hypothetical protein E4U43_004343 [Claviceps pusilla]|uniref:Uncharacterized protein n=1 Tax=Claviceps pusilla TaxID=123648 RepID=A0A9P7T2W2_9HYPO|nr:hypothetical protein E4U43_004343 [Claviceps pusilla]